MAPVNSSTEGKAASRSALLLGILTVAAMLTGVLLIRTLGGTSGRDLAAGATGEAIAGATPLLALAELLKLAIAVCQVTLVRDAAAVQDRWRATGLLGGYAGAALIAASGLVGLYALYAQLRATGASASALGFASAGATAVWVVLFVTNTTLRLPVWTRAAGLAFAAAALASLLFAPVALVAGLLSLCWWFGLSRAFGGPTPTSRR